MAEYVSSFPFSDGDIIKGYQIKKAFEPGGFAYAGKALSSSGRNVFFKKYRRPGGSSPWQQGFIDYQIELKRRIQSDAMASKLCYEFIEFFDRSKPGGLVPKRAFYQVFEWVEGGSDLRKMLTDLEANPRSYDWNQRVVFSKVMVAGIHAIHKAGVIHTDLKPENFYLVPDSTISVKWKIRVIDMDFSILEGVKPPWIEHGDTCVGTRGYMSPEHVRKEIPTKASDVFTLGLILGELLGAGHPAMGAAGGMDNYDKNVLEGGIPSVEIQHPIERVSDLKFLNYVVNACLLSLIHI